MLRNKQKKEIQIFDIDQVIKKSILKERTREVFRNILGFFSKYGISISLFMVEMALIYLFTLAYNDTGVSDGASWFCGLAVILCGIVLLVHVFEDIVEAD